MSTEQNKAASRRIVEAINKGDIAAIDELVAPTLVDHSIPPGIPPGVEGVKFFIRTFHITFPDLHYHIEDEVAEGDRVVQRLTGHGTMKGDLQGMPATGKHATWWEIHVGRFANGKLVEH